MPLWSLAYCLPKKVGYKAIFSRFLDEYIHITPVGKENRQDFIKKLITDVAAVNVTNKKTLNPIVKKVMTKSSTLRYLKMIVQLQTKNDEKYDSQKPV